jgi:hypothetical protein
MEGLEGPARARPHRINSRNGRHGGGGCGTTQFPLPPRGKPAVSACIGADQFEVHQQTCRLLGRRFDGTEPPMPSTSKDSLPGDTPPGRRGVLFVERPKPSLAKL